MTILPLPELGAAERAEEFFEALGVRYDPRILSAHRTRILRLLGATVASLEASIPFLGEEALRAALRGALLEIHASLAAADGAAPPIGGRLVQLRRAGPDRPGAAAVDPPSPRCGGR